MRSSDYANTLYNDYVEVIEKYEILDNKYRQLKKDNRNIKYRINNEAKLKKENKELKETIAKLDKQIEAQETLIEKQALEIQRLKNQINKNSENSSKSPSTDNVNKPKKIYNNREKTDRKHGGQFGHKGKTLTNEEIKKLIDDNKVEHRIVEVSKEEFKVKYVVDIEVTTVVTEYVVKDENDNVLEINKPGNPTIYGNAIKAITALLHTSAKVSSDNITSFLSDLTSNTINLSKGTICNWIDTLNNNLEVERKNIVQQLLNSSLIHVDTTLININGENYYVHNVSTSTHTMQLIHKNKGQAAMIEHGILDKFTGIIVHDHDTSYYKFGRFHAECNIHIIRYLNGVIDFTDHEWALLLKELFYEIKHRKEDLIEQGMSSMPQSEIDEYTIRYRTIVAMGKAERLVDVNTNAYEVEEKRLINRLVKYEENHLLFMVDFSVPFTNNQAELDQRHVKSKQNTGIFRSEVGADNYIEIYSCLSTYKKQGINIFLAITKAFEGNPIII